MEWFDGYGNYGNYYGNVVLRHQKHCIEPDTCRVDCFIITRLHARSGHNVLMWSSDCACVEYPRDVAPIDRRLLIKSQVPAWLGWYTSR